MLRVFGRCRALLLMLSILLAGGTAWAESTLQRIGRSGTVTIGYRESSIPFSYLDGDGKPIGYSIDLCRRIVAALGRQLHRELAIAYRPVNSANRIEAVRNGQVDLECGSTTNNAERRKLVAFSISHFITVTRFMVRSNSGFDRQSLHRATVVTTQGTTAEKTFMEMNLRAKLLRAPDHAGAFALLESGKADAFLMDDILLASLRAAAGDPGRFRILDEGHRVEALAIMLAADDPEFKAVVDGEMRRLIGDGEIYAVYHRWFEQPIPPRGINLEWPPGRLLRNAFRYPSDWAPD